MPRFCSLVFPGQLPTYWLYPVRSLNTVDLPTLGCPTSATTSAVLTARAGWEQPGQVGHASHTFTRICSASPWPNARREPRTAGDQRPTAIILQQRHLGPGRESQAGDAVDQPAPR